MIYRAHFPDNPITPGACIIQIAQELYEQACGHAVEISEVENAKFVKAMTPVPDNCYNFSFLDEPSGLAERRKSQSAPDTVKLQVVVSDDDSSTSEAAEPISIYAKFSLVCKTI
jgi:hypothetical protein